MQNFAIDSLVDFAAFLRRHVFGLPFYSVFHLQYIFCLFTDSHFVANINQYFDVIFQPFLVETEVSLHQLRGDVQVNIFVALFCVLVKY